MIYEKHYVWSVLLRLYHWSFAGSIVTLVITGLYINAPWSGTSLEGTGLYPMLTMRNIHGLAGYLFAAAILVRLFLFFFRQSPGTHLGHAACHPAQYQKCINHTLFLQLPLRLSR